MKRKFDQNFLERNNIYFDLKSIVGEHSIKSIFVMRDSCMQCCYLTDYLSELDVTINDQVVSDTINYADICRLTNEFLQTPDQMIIAIGSSNTINAAKCVKLFSKLDPGQNFFEQEPVPSDVILMAVPATIESGTEANGNVRMKIDGQWRMFSEDTATPEYLLFDSEFAEQMINAAGTDDPEMEHRRMCGLAGGLAQSMNTVWVSELESECTETAAESLRVTLDTMMQYLRKDPSCYENMQKGAYLSGKAVRGTATAAIDPFILKICVQFDLPYEQAALMAAYGICTSVEDYLYERGIIKSDTPEEELPPIDEETLTVVRKTRLLSSIVAPGIHAVTAFRRQVDFWHLLLKLQFQTEPYYITRPLNEIEIERKETDPEWTNYIVVDGEFMREIMELGPHPDILISLANSIDPAELGACPITFDEERLFNLVLRTFHKDTVKHFTDYCERRLDKRTKVFERTSRRYDALFVPERIITEPPYRRQLKRMDFVRGLQALVLETLVLSQKFLEENDLTFYLSEGTLLGAARHNGFIPWDDDVDIMMPREDYDRLVQLADEGKIPPELNFDALENNPKHWVLGAKMQLTRKTNYIQHKVENLSKYCGPYIDIFPLDYWNGPYTKRQYRAQRMVKMCRRLLFMKTGYSKKTKGKFHRILMRIALPFISNKTIEKWAIRNMTKFQNGRRKYFVHLCSYYPFHKEVFPVGFFGEPLMVPFEGYSMPVPKEYDHMLKSIYGMSYDKVPLASVMGMRKHAFELDESTEADAETGEVYTAGDSEEGTPAE